MIVNVTFPNMIYQLEMRVGESPFSDIVNAAPLVESYVTVPSAVNWSDFPLVKSISRDVPSAVSGSQLVPGDKVS